MVCGEAALRVIGTARESNDCACRGTAGQLVCRGEEAGLFAGGEAETPRLD